MTQRVAAIGCSRIIHNSQNNAKKHRLGQETCAIEMKLSGSMVIRGGGLYGKRQVMCAFHDYGKPIMTGVTTAINQSMYMTSDAKTAKAEWERVFIRT